MVIQMIIQVITQMVVRMRVQMVIQPIIQMTIQMVIQMVVQSLPSTPKRTQHTGRPWKPEGTVANAWATENDGCTRLAIHVYRCNSIPL